MAERLVPCFWLISRSRVCERDAVRRPKRPTALDAKSEEYVQRAERAAADIATWPQWMQHNLTPPTVAEPGLNPAYVKAAMEDAINRAYVKGHADGLNCDADSGFGIGECEHVGRFGTELARSGR
jgi:hypothetical protein